MRSFRYFLFVVTVGIVVLDGVQGNWSGVLGWLAAAVGQITIINLLDKEELLADTEEDI